MLGLLAACGGGSGGSSASINGNSGSTGAAVAAIYSGNITGLGSIVVNGVRFETTGVKIHDRDDPYGNTEDSSAMGIGKTVAVEALSADDTQGTGTASLIRVIGGIKGQISAKGSNSLTVAGQNVLVDSATVYQGIAGFSGLLVNDRVEIYGLPKPDGSYLAARIEKESGGATTAAVSLHGIVKSVANGSFVLPGSGTATDITVAYTSGAVSPAGSTIAVGSNVRVLASAAPVNNQVTANKVLLFNPSSLSASSNTIFKLEGIIGTVNGKTFTLLGLTVDASNIANLPSLAAGDRVEVKGTVSGTTLTATKIEKEGSKTASVQSPSGASEKVSYENELYGVISECALSGCNSTGSTFKVQGVTVKIMANTRFEHGLSTLANNAYVEVKGVFGNGILEASKIEIKNASGSSGSSGNASSGTGSSSTSGAKFEMYGTLTCSAYPATCTINTVNANLSKAVWEEGSYASGMTVEASGYMDANNVYQVTKLERKSDGKSGKIEMYGILTCSAYPAACTINTINANLSKAVWEKGSYASGMAVEASGYMDANNVYQVTEIEKDD